MVSLTPFLKSLEQSRTVGVSVFNLKTQCKGPVPKVSSDFKFTEFCAFMASPLTKKYTCFNSRSNMDTDCVGVFLLVYHVDPELLFIVLFVDF